MNIDTKALNKTSANWIQQNIKRIMHSDEGIYPRDASDASASAVNHCDKPHYPTEE